MSKPKKFAVVSGAGLLTRIFTSLADEVIKQGGDEEDIHCLTTPKGQKIIEQIAKLLVDAGHPKKSAFNIVVSYGQSLQEMIEAGKYDYVNGDITPEHFPVEGEGDQAKIVTLFHFNETMTSKKVIAEMDKKGFRPAMIEDLLALGKTQPELQKQFPIVALGSVWRASGGYRRVPYLCWGSVERHLRLYWFEAGWGASWRFLALRK